MLSQLAPPWLPFAASAFARKSAISPSSQLSSTRCQQRRRRLSISLSSAPCRPTRAAGNHCLPDATGSNCLAISRPAFPPPLRSRRGLGHGHVSGPASFAHLRLTPQIDIGREPVKRASIRSARRRAHFCSPISRTTCKRCSSQTARWWPGVQSTSATAVQRPFSVRP